jgi:hypothetical protein
MHVQAGQDPEAAARIVDSEFRLHGPTPWGIHAQDMQPDRIRDLQRRVRGTQQVEGRQQRFDGEMAVATGQAPAPQEGGQRVDMSLPVGAMEPTGGRYGPIVNGPTPNQRLIANMDAAREQRELERDQEVQVRGEMDDNVRAREAQRRAAMSPEERAQEDAAKGRDHSIQKHWQDYKRNQRKYENAGVDFGSYLAARGMSLNAAERQSYLMRVGDNHERQALAGARKETVAQRGMERVGSYHTKAEKALSNPDSTYQQRMAAYTTLGRLNPQMAEEYRNMAALETQRLVAEQSAAEAADLARFGKQPPAKEPEPSPQSITESVVKGLPHGASWDAAVEHVATQMPGDGPQQSAMAVNFLESLMWSQAAHGPGSFPPGSWMWAHMQDIVRPVGADGNRAPRPITLEQFNVAAARHGIQPPQARAIYEMVTAAPGAVPNTHAEVGEPEAEPAVVGAGPPAPGRG